MSPPAQQPTWRRIYRQTITLTYKNMLIFYKAPIVTLVRAFLFPLAVTLVFSFLIHLSGTDSWYNTDGFGISTISHPVHSLADAIRDAPTRKLVFIRNGLPSEGVNPIIEGVLSQPGMSEHATALVTDDPNELFEICKQSTKSSSDCFAAIIFTAFNETNVDYSIAVDGKIIGGGYGDYRKDDTVLPTRILPLQWAIDSQIGNFSTKERPQMQAFSGYFGPGSVVPTATPETEGPFWLSVVSIYVAPIFILIIIGVVYHLSTFVATERETSMSELMAAQNVTATPRILSTMLSFFAIYFPGFLACSIILTQILFKRTSDILFLFITLLAGASTISSTHFVASFFSKAQLAGLYTSTLAFALALVTLAATMTSKLVLTQVTALTFLFPPCTWANFISDVALREYKLHAFSLKAGEYLDIKDNKLQRLNGYLYVIAFIFQIVVYSAATYGIERKLWGVTRKHDLIDASDDVALRVTGLSKTYNGKRPWYWPFMRKGAPILAVDSLNLEVKTGSVTFLLGPNGGGKTTTLKCVAGMTSMDVGSRLELNKSGLVFGICPQSNVFWDTLTVNEHIKIWKQLKTAAYNDSSEDDDDVLAECDLLEKGPAQAKTLSGGQMRKLQLAIAFVGGSKVCCIDEASSGLDPLSRRNIWNIIQKGHSRRTVLVTTHFLDEADVLADHIAIVYKGKLVCEGPGTSLKAQYGDEYIIRSECEVNGEHMVWPSKNSAEATRKILELEALDEDDNSYNVIFPTLEQVFLKVTSETAVHDHGGDGMVGEEETENAIDEKIFAMENDNAEDIDLDVGHSVGLARQILALYKKRYTLLLQKAGWISYGISVIIPVIIAAALVNFMYKFKTLQTCEVNAKILRNATEGLTFENSGYPIIPALLAVYSSSLYLSSDNTSLTILGPASAFTGGAQDELFVESLGRYFQKPPQYELDANGDYVRTDKDNSSDVLAIALATRSLANSKNEVVAKVADGARTTFPGIAIWAPTPDQATFFYSAGDSTYDMNRQMIGFSYLTNRLSNATVTTGVAKISTADVRLMRQPANKVNVLSMPIAVLISLAFISAASIAVIYPAYEKNNRVRALHYSNGVSPFALWTGYLAFDMQFVILESIIVWSILFAQQKLQRLWYEPSYLLGVFILFGMATLLGTYVISLFTKKAAFAIAAGLHCLLFVLYVVAYVMNSSFGDQDNLFSTYSALQNGLGLSSPGANLVRALFLTSNSFEILCGKFADNDISSPFSYDRYGSVYANLLIQILFLTTVLIIYEYGSADWIRRNITHRGVPSRLHYIVETSETAPPVLPAETEKTTTTSPALSAPILSVSRVSKYFGPTFAVENVSFSISANETLALLGGNGAGKTTVINMIRGELKPNFGDIYLDGISVSKQPQKARINIGVCPQDDAIDNLTVRQTLRFYATVKGLKNVEGNVDRILKALNITMYEDLSVRALSGGTRRKLSVAIALLGNPRVLLLDEPSTGQDAGAKRILWRALQSISANRAILLTTHSMEEAEALATNVAIMGTKMLASGTLASLEATHGGAFSIKAVRVPEMEREEAERRVREAFGNVEGGEIKAYEDAHGQVGWEVEKVAGGRTWGGIMSIMEGLVGERIRESEDSDGDLGGGSRGGSSAAAGGSSSAARSGNFKVFQAYTVTGPTLEEVFMNVAREAGQAGGV
ncbi:hypothetical protein VTL71DRAFT_4799 [Oculimacula yallundae]|uniref:ABC transporter domain-containing protein n=1 Tax=Oculimacula yallundae TaxID=86028 RepID=A0ABR4C2Z6_9HELO